LLLDDTFQQVTPLIDGAVNEARQFAPLRDDRIVTRNNNNNTTIYMEP